MGGCLRPQLAERVNMKKIIGAALFVGLLLSSVPAKADNTGAAIVGGIIGGLFLSQALQPQPYYPPQPYYYEPYPRGPNQVRYCDTQYRQEYNPAYNGWYPVPYTVCYYRPY